jgi:hypothetical protein
LVVVVVVIVLVGSGFSILAKNPFPIGIIVFEERASLHP